MKRRTIIQVAALAPVGALALRSAHAGDLHIVDFVITFYDDDGSELAMVLKDGRVVRRAGVTSRCARHFWAAMALDGQMRLIGPSWPLAVNVYNGSDPAWSVELPANGSVKDIRFENVDPSAKFFWSMIQAGRPPDMTWA
ncbi:hypothetical protein LCGC14_0320020 [marine sediment metagenome]|uniref:Uncharacterized protein n=1 Tax=marine sediment metagenome TaxID=412755 RepID=A0A0F9TQ01_9ZZZZ